MLFDAELNARIEHASAYGKAAGEKVPGHRPLLPRALVAVLAAVLLFRSARGRTR